MRKKLCLCWTFQNKQWLINETVLNKIKKFSKGGDYLGHALILMPLTCFFTSTVGVGAAHISSWFVLLLESRQKSSVNIWNCEGLNINYDNCVDLIKQINEKYLSKEPNLYFTYSKNMEFPVSLPYW